MDDAEFALLTEGEQISLLKSRVARLEAENAALRAELSCRAEHEHIGPPSVAPPPPPVTTTRPPPPPPPVTTTRPPPSPSSPPPSPPSPPSPPPSPSSPPPPSAAIRPDINANHLGAPVTAASHRAWYEHRCIQLGLIACLDASEAAGSGGAGGHCAAARQLQQQRCVFFHLHNDEPVMTTVKPTSLPAFREHNGNAALAAALGAGHRRVTSGGAGGNVGGNVYTISPDDGRNFIRSGGEGEEGAGSGSSDDVNAGPTSRDGALDRRKGDRDGGRETRSPVARQRGGGGDSSVPGALPSSSSSLPPPPGETRHFRADERQFTFHWPALTRRIRAAVGVRLRELKAQLDCGTWRRASSPGKSDAGFFFIGDFVIKTLKEAEFRFLRNGFAADYVAHVEAAPATLLPRFLGVFTLTSMQSARATRYVLMENVVAAPSPLRALFDIKGSTVGRDGAESQRFNCGARIWKDNDAPVPLLQVTPEAREALIVQLRRDVELLVAHDIVDYSLVLGICDGTAAAAAAAAQRAEAINDGRELSQVAVPTRQLLALSCMVGAALKGDISPPSSGPPHSVLLGLIDVFQPFTPAKRFEHFAKGLLAGRHEVSVVPPEEYGARLVGAIERLVVC